MSKVKKGIWCIDFKVRYYWRQWRNRRVKKWK